MFRNIIFALLVIVASAAPNATATQPAHAPSQDAFICRVWPSLPFCPR